MLALHCSSQRAAWFSHSLGSAVLAAVIKIAPDMCAATLFSDPICFDLASGDALKNFLYSTPPITAANTYAVAQNVFVSGELSIQMCMRRSFWWVHAWLHPDDLPCDSLVILSRRDTVANAPAVLKKFEAWQAKRARRQRPLCRVQMHPTWHHGFLLFSPKAQRRVISELLLMAAASPPTAQLEPQPVYGTHPVYDKEPSCAVIVPQKKRGLCSKQCSRETDETGSLDSSSSGDESARAASEVLPRL
ncbi:MAG: hypothetical protein SGPRY_009515 [Prymnesium sp.]